MPIIQEFPISQTLQGCPVKGCGKPPEIETVPMSNGKYIESVMCPDENCPANFPMSAHFWEAIPRHGEAELKLITAAATLNSILGSYRDRADVAEVERDRALAELASLKESLIEIVETKT